MAGSECRSPAIGGARWSALGTSVHLLVTEEGRLEAAQAAVDAVLAQVDATYSRFRGDSELSAVNAGAGREMRVSPLFARALGVALRAAAATDGAVDPTVGRAMRAIGYDADLASLPGRASSPTIRLASVPGWRVVRLDPARRTVRLPAGVELDLGSTGKALAADLSAGAALLAMGGCGVLVNLGGDIATAGPAPTGGWRVAPADDARSDAGEASEVVAIVSGAVATSSTTVRRWTRNGVARHHIVDPATGRPADGPWRTVTVAAADCVAANAAATAAIVKGSSAEAWLARLGLPARLVAVAGDVARVGGWPRQAGRQDPSGSTLPDRTEAFA